MKKGTCPICGTENNCSMLKMLPHENCWCTKVKIQKEMFSHIPKEHQGVSCICIKCVTKYNKNEKFDVGYDLHTHTVFSDGTITPKEMVKFAKNRGLFGVAITDHDTIKGISQGVEAGIEEGLEVIPGIEFSSSIMGEDVHILGYFININDEIFKENLEKLNRSREERNKKIIENLRKYKIEITMDELEKEAQGDIISKLHISKLMWKKGYIDTIQSGFKQYLGKNGVAYEGHGNFTPHRAVEIINENGGVAVLAHPKLYTDSEVKLEKLIKELILKGLNGIEIQYPSFTKGERERYIALADKYNLVVTGGSDFHGDNRKEILLGDEGVSYSQYLSLKNRWKEINKNRKLKIKNDE